MSNQIPDSEDSQSLTDPNKSPESSQLVPLPKGNNETYLEKLNHYLILTMSLPERTARALGALVGGSTLLLTRTLLPNAIKNTSSYGFTVGMFQAFLIKNVAGIDHAESNIELQENFVQRKLLGSSLEAAGLLTMHLSPVWVFAIASDAAKGGQVFLQRLVHHLKENEVISQDSNPESLEQILQSIHDMGRRGATAIDTPPLSRTEIAELADELRQSTSNLAQNSAAMIPRFESLWNQINRVARKENLSPEQVLGMLSIHAANLSTAGIGTAGAVGKTGYQVLDDVILTDYKTTLGEISEAGAMDYMKQHMQPFLENAQSHFDFQQETATQRWFKSAIAKFIAKLRPDK